MDLFISQLLNGIGNGVVYASVALALVLIYRTTGLLNFAQGEMALFSTYISWKLATSGLPIGLAIVVSMAIALVGGAVIERVLIRPVEQARSPLNVVIVTLGMFLAINSLAQLVFGADYRQINLPIANRITGFGSLHFSVGYILSFAVSVALVIALRQFLRRTEMGRAIRAVAQNRAVAPLMGIRVERVSAITFGLGIACAGVAGALLLPIFWTNPTVGGPYTLKSFVIVVLGGMGSVQGAALGGLLLGIAEQFTAYAWADRYAEVVNFVIFILVLLFRPQGLFGGKA